MTPSPKPRPAMYHSVEQIRESGLLSPERLQYLLAEVEKRITKCYDGEGREVTNASIAVFPGGERMLYTRMAHDVEGTYMRRDLLSSLLTVPEIDLINGCYSNAGRRRREEERFAKAQHIPEAQWDGWVTDGEHYWDSVWSYHQEREDDDEEDATLPRYLWAAVPEPVISGTDVADLFEHQVTDKGWEEMSVEDDLEGVPEMQAAIDAFVKANEKVVAYHMDTTRAILLDGKGAAS